MKHIIFKINLGEISHEIWNSTKYLHTYILLGKNIIWINDITDSLQICLNFVKTQNCTVSSGFWPLIFLTYLREIPRESRNTNINRIRIHDSQKNRYKLLFLKNCVKSYGFEWPFRRGTGSNYNGKPYQMILASSC